MDSADESPPPPISLRHGRSYTVSEVTPYSEKDFETFLTSVGAEDEGGTVCALSWNEWQGGLTFNFLD